MGDYRWTVFEATCTWFVDPNIPYHDVSRWSMKGLWATANTISVSSVISVANHVLALSSAINSRARSDWLVDNTIA